MIEGAAADTDRNKRAMNCATTNRGIYVKGAHNSGKNIYEFFGMVANQNHHSDILPLTWWRRAYR